MSDSVPIGAPAPAATATFSALYCARNRCTPRQFRPRVFWRTLHWHALSLAPLLLLGDYFESDRALIDACGRATRMQQNNEEIEDHPWHPENIGWLRRGVKLRVSGRRLRKLAARYLAIQMTTPAPWNLVTSARTVNAANPRRERELQDSDFVGVDRAAPALNADTLSGREEFTKPPAPTTQRQQTPC